MNTVNIAIEVNFGEATLNLLQAFVSSLGKNNAQTTSDAEPAKTSKPAPTKPEPAPAAAAPAPKDLPDDLPVSDEELRAAVKAAKDNTSAADVKALFAQFGVKTSSECPDAKRLELLNKLNELAKR